MSAADRAKARREAILKKGGDRLAKLTTTARGSDSGYLTDEQPRTRLSAFVGEDSLDMPKPRSVSSNADSSVFDSASETTTSKMTGATSPPSSRSLSTPPSQQFWSDPVMADFIAGFQKASLPTIPANSALPHSEFTEGESVSTDDPPLQELNPDPLTTLISSMGMFPPMESAMGGNPAFPAQAPQKPKQTTLGKKLMPLIHLFVMWALLAYFAFGKEREERYAFGEKTSWWDKWADLSSVRPASWATQALPFFWVFTSVQIVLHSMWIFTGLDAVTPPTLITLVVPHLPPPIPSIVTTGLKYVQMGSSFLDDVASLIFGIGFLVYLSTLLAT